MIDKLVKPYVQPENQIWRGEGQKHTSEPVDLADGGNTGTVPIVAAGGEFTISPEVVKDIGHGDLNKGHKVLDAFVLHVRKQHIKTLKNLPGPKK